MATLLSLPEEILTAILDHVWYYPLRRELKKLRTVCKAFAQNYSVQRRLFRSIPVVADVTWFESHQHSDLLRFAHFVRKVSFLPPLHNWNLSFEDWHEMLYMMSDHAGDKSDFEPPAEADQAYQRYVAISARNKSLFDGNFILATKWADFLKGLPNCTSFSFGTVDYSELTEGLKPEFPARPQEGVIDHVGIPIWLSVCEPEKNLAVQALCAGLDALRMSDSKIIEFKVASSILQDESWESKLFDGMLDFGKLETLSLGQEQDELPTREEEEDCHSSLSTIANLMLRRYNATISTIKLWGNGWVEWSNLNVSELTFNLRIIQVRCADISNPCLVAMISNSQKLERVELETVDHTEGERSRGWKPVFDAIRQHHQILEVSIMDLYVNHDQFDAGRFIIHSRTNEPTMLSTTTWYPWKDQHVQAAFLKLPMYLHDKIEWTEELKEGFGES